MRQQVPWQREASVLFNEHRVKAGLALYDHSDDRPDDQLAGHQEDHASHPSAHLSGGHQSDHKNDKQGQQDDQGGARFDIHYRDSQHRDSQNGASPRIVFGKSLEAQKNALVEDFLRNFRESLKEGQTYGKSKGG